MSNFTQYTTPYGDVWIPNGPPPGTTVATVSGGADTTILLHLLLANGMIPNTVVTLRTGNYQDSTIDTNPRVQSVLGYLEKLHGVKLNHQVVDRATGHHDITTDIHSLAVKYDHVFSAVTTNPPLEAMIQGLQPQRPGKGLPANEWRKFMTPFQNFDKRVVVSLYHQLKLQDLLNITHSCTTLAAKKCEICFACQERQWAERNT